MGKEFLHAYAENPDVKFILTERNPEKWVKSINNSAAVVYKMSSSFPMNILKYFDPTLFQFARLNVLVYKAVSGARNRATQITRPS